MVELYAKLKNNKMIVLFVQDKKCSVNWKHRGRVIIKWLQRYRDNILDIGIERICQKVCINNMLRSDFLKELNKNVFQVRRIKDECIYALKTIKLDNKPQK